MTAHVRKLAGRSIDFREAFTPKFRKNPAGSCTQLTTWPESFNTPTSWLLLGVAKTSFSLCAFCAHSRQIHVFPLASHPCTKLREKINNFRDTLRGTFAEANARTRKVFPSYLNARTFRTPKTVKVSAKVRATWRSRAAVVSGAGAPSPTPGGFQEEKKRLRLNFAIGRRTVLVGS